MSESVRHRRRLYGVDGVSESIDYLHGTHARAAAYAVDAMKRREL